MERYFVPEKVCSEGIALAGGESRLKVGDSIGFDHARQAGHGVSGESYQVTGWLSVDALPFPGNLSMAPFSTVVGPSVCLKVFGKIQECKSSPENWFEQYEERVRGEYNRLVAALRGGANTPYPFAFGRAYTPESKADPSGLGYYYAIAMSWVGEEGGPIHVLDGGDGSCVSILKGDRGGVLDDLDVALIGLAIARAVRSLHECPSAAGGPMVHRDLYPKNVFVDLSQTSDSGRLHPVDAYLIDLSQSAFVGDPTSRLLELGPIPRLAQENYGAPEMFHVPRKGEPSAWDKARNLPTVDVWSIGSMLYKLRTNKEPYCLSAISDLEGCERIKESKRDITGGENDAGEGILGDLVRRCTTFEPWKRPCLDDVINDLERVVSGESRRRQTDSLVKPNSEPQPESKPQPIPKPEPEPEPQPEPVPEPQPEPEPQPISKPEPEPEPQPEPVPVQTPMLEIVGSKERPESLADAFRIAKSGNTIRLLRDCVLKEPVVIKKDLTLDLGGRQLLLEGSVKTDGRRGSYFVVNNGTLAIEHGVIKGRSIGADIVTSMAGSSVLFGRDLHIFNEHERVAVAEGGKLIVDGADLFSCTSSVSSTCSARSRGTIEVLGGQVRNRLGAAIEVRGASSAIVKGGLVLGGWGGAIRADGEASNTLRGLFPRTIVTIEGGVVESTEEHPVIQAHGARGKGRGVHISGGRVEGELVTFPYTNLFVSGGEFSCPVPAYVCKRGYVPDGPHNGPFGVWYGVHKRGNSWYAPALGFLVTACLSLLLLCWLFFRFDLVDPSGLLGQWLGAIETESVSQSHTEDIDHLPGQVVCGWGDSGGGRTGLTIDEINSGALGSTITFDSITDSKIGDERNFVAAALLDESGQMVGDFWSSNIIEVEAGNTYRIRIFGHNNSPLGYGAVASDVEAMLAVPNESGRTIAVRGFLRSPSADPTEYWDGVVLTCEDRFHLEVIEGSAVLNSNGGTFELPSEIVNGWVKVGYNALDGDVPGCYEYSFVATIEVQTVAD